MDDEEAIPERFREFVKGRQGVWRAKRKAFRDETQQIVAGILGLSVEQVRRHEYGVAGSLKAGEIIFAFQVPDDLPQSPTDFDDLRGPPYVLTIRRDLKSPVGERWRLRLEGVSQHASQPRIELPPLPRGGLRLKPIAVWFAEELSVDLVAQASVGVGFDYKIDGAGGKYTLDGGQPQRLQKDVLQRRLSDIATDVHAIRELLKAEPRGRS
jgi:hypothetical protein